MFAVRRSFSLPAVFLAIERADCHRRCRPRAAPAAEEPDGEDAGADDTGTTTSTAPAPATSSRSGRSGGSSSAPSTHASSHVTIHAMTDGKTVRCREQAAQPFLDSGQLVPEVERRPTSSKSGRKMLEDSIKYRNGGKYGYFEGFWKT